MAPLSVSPAAARQLPLRRIVARIALVAVVSTTAAACSDGDGESPPPGEATGGLVILAGEPGAASLTVHDGRGTAREVALLSPSTAWISAGREGNLVATLDDGTLRISGALRTDAPPAWSETPGQDTELPPEPLHFASWSPNGRRIAAIASRFGAEARLTVAIVDPVGDASLLLPVPRRPLVAPPTWLSDERILVQTSDGFAVVDTGSGDVAVGPHADLGGGVSVAAAADGSLVAIADANAGAIEIRDLARWLGGDMGNPVARLEVEGEVGAVAFDRRAARLAVVWQQPDGPGTLAIYRAAEGWREAGRMTLPGESARAVVDWLP